uniref:WAP domain-containing protein n=1 Tax=Periophthalmus magnuspinnatus TaxID=409849 RepID=A0A3B4BB90_9GOBI
DESKLKHYEMFHCDFLVSALSLKQGQCPGPDRAQGFEAACVQSCTRDQDCPKTRKCCSNGCGQTCQTPDQAEQFGENI